METSQDFMHTKTEKMLKESQYKTKLAEKLGMDPAILLDKGNVINGVTISGNSKTIIPCAKCGTIGPEARCGRCKSNYYCSSDWLVAVVDRRSRAYPLTLRSSSSQKKDWPNHKKDCVPISDDSKKEAMKLIKVVLQDESVLREGREMMAKLAI